MLISEEYRKQNHELHFLEPRYGTGKKFNHKSLMEIMNGLGTTDILDYGCGKAMNWKHFDFPFRPKLYDPVFPEYSARPDPADVVLCIAVLEHVEPDCLDEVIKDLYRVTKLL